jgi:hypothetical protein
MLLSVGLGVALDRVQLSETVKPLLLGAGFLGPLAINAVLLLRHEMTLKAASTLKAVSD